MPPSLFSPYPLRVGTQILLTDLHYDQMVAFLLIEDGITSFYAARSTSIPLCSTAVITSSGDTLKNSFLLLTKFILA